MNRKNKVSAANKAAAKKVAKLKKELKGDKSGVCYVKDDGFYGFCRAEGLVDAHIALQDADNKVREAFEAWESARERLQQAENERDDLRDKFRRLVNEEAKGGDEDVDG